MQPAVTDCLRETISSSYGVDLTPVLTRPEPQFGDLATNVALQLAKQVGKKPHEIAETLAGAVRELDEVLEVSIAGPGFINIRLTDAALLMAWSLEPEQHYRHQTVVVEYSDPNPFKEIGRAHV